MDHIKPVVNMLCDGVLLLLLFGTQMALAYYIMHGFRIGKETFSQPRKLTENERRRKTA